MGQGFTIRKGQEADRAALHTIFVAAIEGADAYTPAQRKAWIGTKEVKGRKQFWVAEAAGVVVGFIDCEPKKESIYIDMLYVHPDFHRQGMGAALLQAVLSEGQAQNITDFSVEASIPARPLFEAHGFQCVATQEVERGGEVLTNYRMVFSFTAA